MKKSKSKRKIEQNEQQKEEKHDTHEYFSLRVIAHSVVALALLLAPAVAGAAVLLVEENIHALPLTTTFDVAASPSTTPTVENIRPQVDAPFPAAVSSRATP